MTIVLINVLLAIPFIALWAGIPLWMVLRRPETRPAVAAVPAVRTLPAARREDAVYQRVA